MAATLESPLLANKAAAAGGGSSGFQIEKSLRFNDGDSPSLRRTFSLGNRRTWTVNFWLKQSTITTNQGYFSGWTANDDEGWIQIGIDENAKLYIGSATDYLRTSRLFKDPGAWMMITVAVDTTQAVAAERIKMYINGEQETDFGTEVYPSQNDLLGVNSTGPHTVGCRTDNSDGTNGLYSDGYLAQVEFIDGLQLSPSAFGSHDSKSGLWNPKAFAIPTINTGTTWSGTTTGADGFNKAITNGFDGKTNTEAEGDTNGESIVLPVTATINKGGVRVYGAWTGSHPGVIKLYNGTSLVEEVFGNTSGGKWWSSSTYNGEITSIDISRTGNKPSFSAIEINGAILIDGRTDVATRSNPHNGMSWSSVGTASNWDSSANYGIDKAFQGYTVKSPGATGVSGGDGATSTNTSAATYDLGSDNKITGITNLQIFAQTHSSHHSGTNNIKINDTDISTQLLAQNTANTWGWVDLGTTFTEFQKIEVKNWFYTIGGIKVNGHILSDGIVDNSFHLKFNDTSTNAALGKDSLFSTANHTASGGAILNTKLDDAGDLTLDSGHNGDSNSTHLALAVAGNTIADVSHTVKGSGSAVVLTTHGDAVASTDQSKFYGTSLKFDGTGDAISTAAISTNSKFCMEFWMRASTIASARPFNGSDDLNGQAYLYVELQSNGAIKCRQESLGIIESGSGKITANTWHHIAYTYDDTTERLFIDGVLEASGTGSWTPPADMKFMIGANEASTSSGNLTGYIQDARLYFGTAKYTAAFTPACTGFTVNNLTSETPGPNDGTTWSGNLAASDGFSHAATLAFNGATGDRAGNNLSSGGGTLTYTGNITVHNEISILTGIQNQVQINGSINAGTASSDPSWVTYTGALDVTGFVITAPNSNGYRADLFAVKVDGVILVDDSTTNTGAYSHGLDSLVDTPTNYGTDAQAGGEVRGNYCVLNALNTSPATLSQGNLVATSSSGGWYCHHGTVGTASGKWYFEVELVTNGSECVGIVQPHEYTGDQKGSATCRGYDEGGTKRWNNQNAAYGNSWNTVGDIVSVAYDLDGGDIWFAINGTWQNSATKSEIEAGTNTNAAFTDLTIGATYVPFVQLYNASSLSVNFGQRAWKYPSSVPSGFKALCTQNLPDLFSGDNINNPSKYFNTKIWTGNGVARNIGGFQFQPDFTWIKQRNAERSNILVDALRGAGYVYNSNNPDGHANDPTESISAWTTDGFTVGTGNGSNQDTGLYVNWNWNANSVTASTDGNWDTSSDYSQRLALEAGFSISKWDSINEDVKVGHALGEKPEMIWTKRVDASESWRTYHHKHHASNPEQYYMRLDDSGTPIDEGWMNDSPVTNEFFWGHEDWFAPSTEYIAYSWVGIPGFSKFDKYTGATNIFIHTGFKPAWLMVKHLTAGQEWFVADIARNPRNGIGNTFFMRTALNSAERNAENGVEWHSNGFRLIHGEGALNNPGDTYIYAAFAEHPHKTSRAN